MLSLSKVQAYIKNSFTVNIHKITHIYRYTVDLPDTRTKAANRETRSFIVCRSLQLSCLRNRESQTSSILTDGSRCPVCLARNYRYAILNFRSTVTAPLTINRKLCMVPSYKEHRIFGCVCFCFLLDLLNYFRNKMKSSLNYALVGPWEPFVIDSCANNSSDPVTEKRQQPMQVRGRLHVTFNLISHPHPCYIMLQACSLRNAMKRRKNRLGIWQTNQPIAKQQAAQAQVIDSLLQVGRVILKSRPRCQLELDLMVAMLSKELNELPVVRMSRN